MITKARFLVIFVLTSALLLTSIPVNLLNRAGAAQFVIVVPSGPHAGKVVAIISLSSAAAQAVSENSGALQEAKPVLSISPTSVALNTTLGTNPADPELTISNTGPVGSILNWSASASDSWIGLSQVSGTVAAGSSTPVVVGADVNVPVVLGVETYTGTITISDPNASLGSPQTVAVTLNIAPAVVEQTDHSQEIETYMSSVGRQKITVPTTMAVSAVELYVAFSGNDVPDTSYVSINAATSDDGQLGDLMGTSGSVTLSSNQPQTQLYSFASPITLPKGIYWIVPNGDNTAIWGSKSNPYAGGYWYWPTNPGFTASWDAYFKLVTQ